MKILDKIFSLPPVDVRPNIYTWSTVNAAAMTRDSLYIVHQAGGASFQVISFLIGLSLSSIVFQAKIDLFFFQIDLIGKDYFIELIESFPWYSSPLLLLGVVPFYFLKALYLVDFRTENVFAHQSEKFMNLKTSDKWAFIVMGAVFVSVLMLFSDMSFKWFTIVGLIPNNFVGTLLCLAFYLYLYPVFVSIFLYMMVLSCSMVFYKNEK